ncbi:hypothetical protein BASA81_001595 [Batrachochytrium salamandrivorans]|nr:hypothetical protein BASA81_001595 [Batrachochytrium salamandrivorans]
MESSLAALLAYTATLETKGQSERTKALKALSKTLDLSELPTNKTRGQTVLDNKAAMDVLLNLSAMTSSADVVEVALWVLLRLARDDDSAKRLFQEHPSLVLVAMRKLEFWAENSTEGVKLKALGVLHNLAINDDNKRKMVTKNPTLVSLLVAKVESSSEQVQAGAFGVLGRLAINVDNAREMAIKNPRLVPLLVTKAESNLERVQIKALGVLNNLAIDVDNATEMMAASSAVLLPLLVEKMNGGIPLQATGVVYGLSCSPANRAILCGNDSVVAALIKGRENRDTSFFSLLALVNLFGEDSEVLKTNLEMLQRIFELIAPAMNKVGCNLNNPFIAFRYLCVVEHNRQLLWSYYQSKFLTTILFALQQAIYDKNAPAVENAVITLVQFSNDTEPLAWMRRNKLQLDQVIAQLAPFPKALKMAQFLLHRQDPVDTKASTSPKRVLSNTAPAKRQQVTSSKPLVPQNEQEIRQWLSKRKSGEEVANKLVNEGLVGLEALEMLSKLNPTELKSLVELNAMQALTLSAALNELF